MKPKKLTPRTERVTIGQELLGTIRVTDRGHEVFGPEDQYLATYPTIEASRRALFEMHRDSTKGLESA